MRQFNRYRCFKFPDGGFTLGSDDFAGQRFSVLVKRCRNARRKSICSTLHRLYLLQALFEVDRLSDIFRAVDWTARQNQSYWRYCDHPIGSISDSEIDLVDRVATLDDYRSATRDLASITRTRWKQKKRPDLALDHRAGI